MEYIEPNYKNQKSLEDYLCDKPLELAQVLRWSVQFCHGMEYAHLNGIKCHRDIKPPNILISSENNIKITDFGLSGALDKNLIIGTPTHMPPEQFINSESCDERSDVYSFGIVLYQMVTDGKLPFYPKISGNIWLDLSEMHRTSPVPEIRSLLRDIIYKCLEKDPDKRYQSFGELRKDLEKLLGSYNGEVVEVPKRGAYESWEFNNKGNSLNNLGRYGEALPLLNKAIGINSEYADAWNNKGFALAGLGNYPEAIRCFKKAIKLNSRNANAWYNLGVAYAECGADNSRDDIFVKAIPCFEKAIEIDQDYCKAWFNKALAKETMHKCQDAIEDYRHFLECAPAEYDREICHANERLRILSQDAIEPPRSGTNND